jgi:hypothetical protein
MPATQRQPTSQRDRGSSRDHLASGPLQARQARHPPFAFRCQRIPNLTPASSSSPWGEHSEIRRHSCSPPSTTRAADILGERDTSEDQLRRLPQRFGRVLGRAIEYLLSITSCRCCAHGWAPPPGASALGIERPIVADPFNAAFMGGRRLQAPRRSTSNGPSLPIRPRQGRSSAKDLSKLGTTRQRGREAGQRRRELNLHRLLTRRPCRQCATGHRGPQATRSSARATHADPPAAQFTAAVRHTMRTGFKGVLPRYGPRSRGELIEAAG